MKIAHGSIAWLVIFASGCLGAPAMVAADAGQPPEKLTMYTDWYAEADQGGFFEAVAQGLYERRGIAVDIQAGAPRMPIFPLVARNRVAFATSNSNDVITAVSEGFPLVIVLAYFQRSPLGIMYDAAHPIHSFHELDGRIVMAQPAAAWVRFLEKKYQIKMDVVPITWGIGRFLSDPSRTFLQQVHVTNEPYLVRQAGREPGVLPVFESGYSPYRVVYSSRDFVSQHPDQVRAFVEASLEGWKQYQHGDPAPADALIKAHNREMNDDILAFGRSAMLQYHLVDGLAESGEALGKLDLDRLQQTITTLRELNVIRASPSARELVFP